MLYFAHVINDSKQKLVDFATKIYNLEIYPFACGEPKLDENAIGDKLPLNSDLSRLSIFIVMRRIYKYLIENKLEKPIFVFRKYDRVWENYLKRYLVI